jgi:hypothetical protein
VLEIGGFILQELVRLGSHLFKACIAFAALNIPARCNM